MHFQGKELISRSTHVAHRSLISVASIAIISRYFELNLEDIKIFGMGFMLMWFVNLLPQALKFARTAALEDFCLSL